MKHTKEAVVLRDPHTIRFIRCFAEALPADMQLLQSSVPDFRQTFEQLLTAVGCNRMGFKPYSLRRGGATMHFRRHQNFEATLLLGRWADSRTARIYLEDAVQTLLSNQFNPNQLEQFRVLSSALAYDVM